ncbi:fused MFS/spermidine synthase [Terriglobus sp. YAF25]|uniref:fused MFS/spermidine synthase n=1 Tax=Terriglobus sp. YAF25 TaxID=3233080 RepID=UPI003F97D19D
MDSAYLDHTSRNQRRTPVGVEPIVHRDGNRVSLQFQIGEIQSEMLVDDPVFLTLPYTRTMIDFMLCHRNPTHIVMIGLGGGSIPKWCYREMPAADITVIEIDPQVIALRDRFHIPLDDHRFRVIDEDGADYVARAPGRIEVLLVDGFDIFGQPPQLCSQAFYDDCYRALTPDGVLVVNLCGPESEDAIEYLRRSFRDRVLVATPEDSENRIVLATKGEHRWVGEEPYDELMRKLRLHLWHAPTVRI